MAPLDLLAIFIINLIWGVNFIAVKIAVAEWPPLLTNMVRFSIAALFFLPFIRWVPGRMKMLILTALSLGVLHFGTMYIAMRFASDIGPLAIASQLNVPFATLLAIFFLKENIGWKRIFAVGLAFSGVLVLGFDAAMFQQQIALIWMVVSAFFYATSAILMRQLRDVSPLNTQAWVALAAVLLSAVLSFLWEGNIIDNLQSSSRAPWLAVLYTAVASSVIGHGGMNYLYSKYEVTVISPYLLMMPVFGVLAGIVYLGESLDGRAMIGGLLTLSGVFIVTIRNSRKVPTLPVETTCLEVTDKEETGKNAKS